MLGEAHAKKDTPDVASSAKRFTAADVHALGERICAARRARGESAPPLHVDSAQARGDFRTRRYVGPSVTLAR